MKKFSLVLSLLVGLFYFSNAYAQTSNNEFTRCGHTEWHENEIATNPEYAANVAETLKRRKYIVDIATGKYPDNGTGSLTVANCANDGPVIIPVAVHYDFAITAGDEACLISLAEQQIDILNADYSGNNASGCSSGDGGSSDACIEFVLANKNHPAGTGLVDGDAAVTFNSYGCGPANPCNISTWNGYLNIVVQTGTGVLGIAPLNGSPTGTNTVVIEACAFGGIGPDGFPGGCSSAGPQNGCGAGWNYDGGATATHEIGHYLGLDHTFCNDNGNGQGSCTDNDCDGFTDTPPQNGSNYGCVNVSGGCPQPNACGDTFDNFMDYLDDGCMNSFTDQQTETMFDRAFADNYVDPASVFSACLGIAIDTESATCNGSTDYSYSITVTLDNTSTYTLSIVTGSGTTTSDVTNIANGTFTITYTGIALGTDFQVQIVDDNDAACVETGTNQNLTCQPCTAYTDGPYVNLDNVLAATPTCGTNCGNPVAVTAFEVFSNEAYTFSNLTAGNSYTVDVCSGTNAGSWNPDIVIVPQSDTTNVVASSGGACTVNFTVPTDGDYYIIITNAGDGSCPDATQVLDNGNLQVTQTNCPAACPPCDADAVWVDADNAVVADPAIICPGFENIPTGADDICFAFAPTGTPDGSIFGLSSDEGTFFDSSPSPAVTTSVADGTIAYICFSQAEIDGSGGTSTITFTTDAGNVTCTNGLTIDWATISGSNDIANNFCNCVIEDGVAARTDTTVCVGSATTVPFSVNLGAVPAADAVFASLDNATSTENTALGGTTACDGGFIFTVGTGISAGLTQTGSNTSIAATGTNSVSQFCVNVQLAAGGFNDSYYIGLGFTDGTNNWIEDLYVGEVYNDNGVVGPSGTATQDSPAFDDAAGGQDELDIDICFDAGTVGYTSNNGMAPEAGTTATFDGTLDGFSNTTGGIFTTDTNGWIGQNSDAGTWFVIVDDVNCFFTAGTSGTLADAQVDFETGASGPTPCTFTHWLDTDGTTVLSTNENHTLDVSAFATGTYTYTAVGDCGGSECTDIFVVTVEQGPNPGDITTPNTFDSPMQICASDTDFELASGGASGLDADQSIAYAYWVLTDPLGNTTIAPADLPGGAQASYTVNDANFEGYFTAATTLGTNPVLPVEATGATYYIAPVVINADGTLDVCTDVGTGIYVEQFTAFSAFYSYDECTGTISLSLFGGQPETDAAQSYTLSVTNDADPGTELAPNTNPFFADNPIDIANFAPGTYSVVVGDATATDETATCSETFSLTIPVDCSMDIGVSTLADAGTAGIVSSDYDFGGGVDTLVQSADEFVLTATTDITAVEVQGFFSGGATGNAIDYNVVIYSNTFGNPGAAICSFTGITPVDPTDDSPVIELPSACTLGAGTYWISVYFTHDQAAGDPRWNWTNATSDSGTDALLLDTDDFFGAGATTWTNINTLTGSTDYFDLAFALYTAPVAGDADAITGSNILCCGESITITNTGADFSCTSDTLAYAIATTNDQAGVMAAIAAGDAYFAAADNSLTFTHACPGLAAGTYYVIPFLANKFSTTPEVVAGCEDYGNGVAIQVVDDITASVTAVCGATAGTFDVTVTSIAGGTGTYTISDNLGSSFTEAPAGTFTATGITITDFAAYTVTVANTTNGQTDGCPVDFTVTEPSCGCALEPTAEAGTAAAICADATVDLTALGASIGGSASTATWSGAGSFDNTAFGTGTTYTPSVAEITAGSATITLTTDDPDGTGPCIAAVDNVIVTINTLPNESAPSATVVCADATPVTLSAPAGYSYSWANAGETTQSINVSASGNYDVTITDGNGCSQTLTYPVTVNTLPNEPAPSATVVCADATPVTLSAPAGYSYSWANAGETTQSITVSTSGNYDVTITDDNGCSQTLTYPVTVNTLPNEPAPSATVACQDDTPVTLSAPAGYSYSWANAGETTQSINVSASGNYDVTITDGNGCSQTLTYPVTINALPNEPAPSATVVCADATPVTLSAPAGYSYSWANAGETTQSINVSASGNYIVTITNTTTNCSQLLAYPVTINPIPNADAGTTTELTCTTTQVILNGSSTTSGVTYAWTTNDGTIVSGASTANPTVNAAGTYTLTVTNPANGCTASDNVTITSNTTAPIAEAGVGGEVNCAVTTVSLNGAGSSTGANYTYSWSGPNVVLNGNTLTPVVGAGTYTLTVTDTSNGCTATDQVTVTQSADVPSAVITGAEDLTCLVSDITLTANETGNAGLNVTYTWTLPDASTQTGTSINTSTAGTYTLTVDNNDNGCSISASATIADDTTAPTAVAGGGGELNCTTSSLTLNTNGSSLGADFTYAWSSTDGNFVSGENTANPEVNAAGTYTLTVTDNSNGCTATDDVVVTANADIPTANAGETQYYCGGDDVTLMASPDGFSYEWSGPNNFTSNEQNPTISNVSALADGIYTLIVTNDSNGCSSSAIVGINVSDPVNAGADNSATFCEGDNSTFDLTTLLSAGVATDGNWSAGPSIDISTLSEGSYQYSYTLLGTSTCPNDEAVMTINIVGTANAGSDGGTSICSSDAGTFDLNTLLSVDADLNGTWAPAGPNVDFSGFAEGSYTYTYSVPGATDCPGDDATFVVNITANANAGADNSATVCEGVDTTFDLSTLLSADAALGGTWSDGPVIDVTTLTIGSTTYSYTVSGSGSCAADEAIFTLTLTAAPNAGSDNEWSMCDDAGSLDLNTLLSFDAETGGTWSDGPIIDLTGSAPGDYNYTYTVEGCGSDVANFTITLVEVLTAGADNAATICEGGATSFDLSTLLDETASAGGTWNAGPVIDVTALPQGTYTYTYALGNFCGIDEATFTLEITAAPSAGNDNSASVCEGVDETFDLSTLLDGASVGGTWSDGPIVTVGTAGTYTYTYTTGGLGCPTDEATFTLTVVAAANAGADASTSICEGAITNFDLATLLSADAQTGGTWSDGPVLDLTTLSNGTYTYTYTVAGSNGCPDDVATITLNITDAISAGADNSDAFCETDGNSAYDLSALLSADAEMGGTWSDGSIVDLTTAGTYTFTYSVGGVTCPLDEATFTITVYAAANAGADNSAFECFETLGSFNLTTLLSTDAQTGGTWSEGPVLDLTTLSNGTYTYTYTVAGEGTCASDEATFTITIDDCVEPTIEITDPCDCDDTQNFEIDGNYFVNDVITITGPVNDIWFASSYSGLFDTNGDAITGVISPTSLGGGVYEFSAYFIAGTSYTITFENGEGDNLTVSNDGTSCTCIQTGAVAGMVFWDQNENGLNDNEPGVANAQVSILNSLGEVMGTVTTTANGQFAFVGLEPGIYTVQITFGPGGYFLTTDPSYEVTVVEGETTIMGTGFGYEQIEANCDELVVIAEAKCVNSNTAYNVILTIEGGNLGNEGYLITSNSSALNGVVVDGSITDGPFLNGVPFSYTISSVSDPNCSVTVSQSSVQCIVTSIELLDFDGRAIDNANQLDWTTATEVDNDYFILEKSIDGVNFQSIAEIKGAGNSNSPIGYSYLDTEIENSTAYYRLLAVDFNGEKEIVTDIVEISRNVTNTLTVQPVPASSYIDINLSNALTNWQLQVFDINGKLLVNSLIAGQTNTYQLGIENFATGTYFLVVQDGDNVMTTKFIKK